MKQIHIDLETLDTEHTAKVLSLGAACGSKTLYVEIDQSHYGPQFTESQSTVDWWAAKGGFKPHTDSLTTPHSALASLCAFIHDASGGDDFEVWANSPTFDCAIIRNHYRAFNMACPWGYWQERDVRTIRKLAERLRLNVARLTNPHHALIDAQNQEALVCAVQRTLGDSLQQLRDMQFECDGAKGVSA